MNEKRITHDMKTVRIRYEDGTIEYAHVMEGLLGVLISYAETNGYEAVICEFNDDGILIGVEVVA